MVLGIYGGGGLGKDICDLVSKTGNQWDDIVIIDDMASETLIHGKKVMNYDIFVSCYTHEMAQIAIAQGEPLYKKQLYDKIKMNQYSCATIIHPNVEISFDSILGEGVLVFEGCHIGAETVVGNCTCLMPYVALGHNVRIGSNAQISCFTAVGGYAWIGDSVYIGFSASVRDRIKIGGNSIISQGACVLQDIPENVVAMGNPARVIRNNNTGKIWI